MAGLFGLRLVGVDYVRLKKLFFWVIVRRGFVTSIASILVVPPLTFTESYLRMPTLHIFGTTVVKSIIFGYFSLFYILLMTLQGAGCFDDESV